MSDHTSRRIFLENLGVASLGAVAAERLLGTARAQPPDAKILGAEGVKTSTCPKEVWQPLSDRRIRVGIVGYGVCQTERRPHLPGGRFAGGSPDSTPCATRGGRGPECAQDTLAPAACRWPAR